MLLLLSLLPGAFAQEEPAAPATTGVLAGQVLDPGGMAVPGVRLSLAGQVVAVTDYDGRFTLELPAGEHELTTPGSAAFAPGAFLAVVEPGVRTTVAITLAPAASEPGDVMIVTSQREGEIETLQAERQESADVVDTLSAEEMSRRGDSSAAAALQRVTGLTVVDGRYVYVRGLGERYSATLLNGAALPSPEPERRVVPLDLFPAALLESVVIQKSASPDMPAEFGGGVVQLRTRGVPPRPLLSVAVSGAYQRGTTFQGGLQAPPGPTDWLGFGAGYRALPQEIVAATAAAPLVQAGILPTDQGYSAEELEALGEALPNRWGLATQTALPDVNLSIAAGDRRVVGGAELGALAGLVYASSWQIEEYRATYYGLEGQDLRVVNQYDFQDATREVRLGGLLELAADLPADHAVSSVTVLTRDSESLGREYIGENYDIGGTIRAQRSRWVERQLLVEQLRGEHPLGPINADWRYAYAQAGRLEPDRRDAIQVPAEGDAWKLRTQGSGNDVFYSDLGDTTHDAGLDLALPLGGEPEDPRITVKTGGGATLRGREVAVRRFAYTLKGAGTDSGFLVGEPEEIFVAENIDPDRLQLEEATQATDNYSASQRLYAAYLMADARLLPRLGATGGARLERSEQRVETFQLFNPDQVPVVADLSTSDLLPSGALTWRINSLEADFPAQIRAGYGRTLSRPDLRELSPAVFNDVVGGREVVGNPDLKRAIIDNVDLRAEVYLSADESVSVGGFYKRFADPIETVVVVSAVSRISYANAERADNLGAELEYRKSLGFGDSAPWREALYLSGNLALVRSTVDLGEGSGDQTSQVRPLQGQSPYVVNAQLSYEPAERPLSAAILYNSAGPRIAEVGEGGLPDTYEQPVHLLDASVGWAFDEHWRLKASGRNLLDAPRRYTVGSQTALEVREGWAVGLGVSWSAD